MALCAVFPAACSSGFGGGRWSALADSLGSNPSLDISPPQPSPADISTKIFRGKGAPAPPGNLCRPGGPSTNMLSDSHCRPSFYVDKKSKIEGLQWCGRQETHAVKYCVGCRRTHEEWDECCGCVSYAVLPLMCDTWTEGERWLLPRERLWASVV